MYVFVFFLPPLFGSCLFSSASVDRQISLSIWIWSILSSSGNQQFASGVSVFAFYLLFTFSIGAMDSRNSCEFPLHSFQCFRLRNSLLLAHTASLNPNFFRSFTTIINRLLVRLLLASCVACGERLFAPPMILRCLFSTIVSLAFTLFLAGTQRHFLDSTILWGIIRCMSGGELRPGSDQLTDQTICSHFSFNEMNFQTSQTIS